MRIEIEKWSIPQIQLFKKGVIDHTFVLTVKGPMALLCHGTEKQGKFYKNFLRQEVARCDFLVVCHSSSLPNWARKKVPSRLQTPHVVNIEVKKQNNKYFMILTIK